MLINIFIASQQLQQSNFVQLSQIIHHHLFSIIIWAGQEREIILSSQQSQRMNFPARKNKERQILQQNVGYAEGSLREYLNIKRSSKDKCCLVIFFLYIAIWVIFAAVGFFFGNFRNIGTFVVAGTQCNQLISYSSTADTYACNLAVCTPPTTYGYLQKVCVDSSYVISNSQLAVQISIYSFNLTLPLMVYMNFGIVVGLIILFCMVICCPKIVYSYIFISFGILLGFAFYLLKTIKDRVDSLTTLYSSDSSLPTSQLILNQESMQPLAYILLAGYLILFPVILFSPGKIKMAVNILSKMYAYFQNNYTVVVVVIFSTLFIYGFVFLIGFLLLNFATDGSVVTSSNSFFYLYESVNLVHPAALIFFFFGVYWIFGVTASFQQYIIASSMTQWYFEDGGKIKPVLKGAKRGWYNLGSQAIDSLFIPLQWLVLLSYSVFKMDSQTVEQYQNEHHQDCLCFSNCLFKLRQLFTKIYIKINRGSPVAAVLTNNTFIESCQLAAVTFSDKKHRFFNIGGSLTLFLSLFVTLITLFINYLVLYYQNYDVFPARVNSLQLQVVLAIFLGISTGMVLGNLFGTSVDALLFCFLKEKNGSQSISEIEIKNYLEELYSAEEDSDEVQEMYEIESDSQ